MRRAVLILALLGGSAHAEFMTGNDLLQEINGDTYAARGAGLGYVIGVFDTLHSITHCPPKDVTSGQVRDMVRNYLTNVPGERHLSADVLVARVLKAAWPCPTTQRRGNT